jgi:hypothetical protein
MRHIWSLLAGIIITPLAWALIAIGQAVNIGGDAIFREDQSARLLSGGGLLLAAGLLVGLIGGLRVSPVGALVPAIVFIGVSVYSWLDPLKAGLNLNRIDWSMADTHVSLFAPVYTGVLPVLGATLAICAFSSQRWRSTPRPAAPATVEPAPTAHVYEALLSPAGPDEPTSDLVFGPDRFTPPSPATTPAPATPAAGSGADAPSWPKPQ